MNDRSPFALIAPEASLGEGVRVGPFAVIEPGVVLGDGCIVETGAVIRAGTKLGPRVRVHPRAVIGGLPQDYAFDPATTTGVGVGEGTVIREGVTINRATKPGTDTRVGAHCMLMACSHVGHDALVGDNVTLANGALLAGHTEVGDRAFISGNVAIHQFNRVGRGAIVAAGAVITLDIPPYAMAADRNGLIGLNLVGLRRAGASREGVAALKDAWRRVYDAGAMNVSENAIRALASGDCAGEEARIFLTFLAETARRRGFARPRSETPAAGH